MRTTDFLRTASCVLLISALTPSCATTHSAVTDVETQPEVEEPPAVVAEPVFVEPMLAEAGDPDLAMPDNPMPMEPMEPMTPMASRLTSDGIFYVLTDEPRRPLVRYTDGQLAVSNSCGIRTENKLNRSIPPMYVNGLPIGFC